MTKSPKSSGDLRDPNLLKLSHTERNRNHNDENSRSHRVLGGRGENTGRYRALPSADSALGAHPEGKTWFSLPSKLTFSYRVRTERGIPRSVRTGYEKVDFLYPQACVPTCVGNFLSPMCEIFVVTGFLDLINFVVTVF